VAAAPAVTEKAASVPVPVAEGTAPVAKPAVLDKNKIARPPAAGELIASALPIGGVRTLDDTIIELLRPMIRQWLDDNMPRMVEKALRIELAASLQAKGVSGQTDPSKH
jgi:cell pole-organizing protein PopZ